MVFALLLFFGHAQKSFAIRSTLPLCPFQVAHPRLCHTVIRPPISENPTKKATSFLFSRIQSVFSSLCPRRWPTPPPFFLLFRPASRPATRRNYSLHLSLAVAIFTLLGVHPYIVFSAFFFSIETGCAPASQPLDVLATMRA